jgi:hypothetical protein
MQFGWLICGTLIGASSFYYLVHYSNLSFKSWHPFHRLSAFTLAFPSQVRRASVHALQSLISL